MAEYISREATIKRIKEVYCVGCNSYHGVRCRACGTGDAIDMIDDFPAADVAPVVHGRWEWDPEDIYRCSNCAEKSHVKEVMGHPDWGYCPSCGAKMDGGDSDEAD